MFLSCSEIIINRTIVILSTMMEFGVLNEEV